MTVELAVHLDVQVTRRKRFIWIEHKSGEQVWVGQRLTDALEWLYEGGHQEFLLVTENKTFHTTLAVIGLNKEA